jgi:hypothetical protein
MSGTKLVIRDAFLLGMTTMTLWDAKAVMTACTGCGSIAEVTTPVALNPVNLGSDIAARISAFTTNAAANWKQGDIAFIGDSITDYARNSANNSLAASINPSMDPLIPRSHNFGITGATIANTITVIDALLITDASAAVCRNPSQVHVLVGANSFKDAIINPEREDGFDCVAQADYLRMLERLKLVKENFNGRIVIHSNIPGLWVPADIDNTAYAGAIRDANVFLRKSAAEFGFEFLDLHSGYLNGDQVDLSYFLQEGAGPYYYLHPSRKGQKVRLSRVAPIVFTPLTLGTTTNLATLTAQPSAPPATASPTPSPPQDIKYRYATVKIPPFHRLILKVNGSSGYNYVSIYDPTNPTYHPADYCLESGSAAESCIENTGVADKVIFAVMGAKNSSGEIAGAVSLSCSPLNNSCGNAAALAQSGTFLGGNLTYQASLTGVWYALPQNLPAGTPITAVFHDKVSALATISILKWASSCGLAASQDSDSRIFSSSCDLHADYTTVAANEKLLVNIRANTASPVEQAAVIRWGEQSPYQTSAFLGGSSGDSAQDYMPDVSSDENGNLLAVWYRQTTPGTEPSLMYSKSTNDGVTWPPAQTVAFTGNIRSGAAASPPRIAAGGLSGSGQWRVIYPSGKAVKVAHLSASNVWSIETPPVPTNCSLLLDPHIVHRAEHDDKWIASWTGQKDDANCLCTNKTLYASIKSTDGSFPWFSIDAAEPQVPCATCGGASITASKMMTAIRTPAPANGEYVSASAWLEKYDNGLNSVKGIFYQTVMGSPFEIVNPQIAWFEDSSEWIVAWSMRNPAQSGSDLDVYYSKWSHGIETWTVPQLLLAEGAYDGHDDILEQLVSQSSGSKIGMLVRRALGTDSNLYVSDSTNASTWTAPKIVGNSANIGCSNFSHGRMAPDSKGKWIIIYQTTGTGSVADSNIVISRE